MDAVIDLIKKHRSIRRFTDQAIDSEVFTNLILAGQAASTSSYIQATSIVRVTKPDIRAAFAELAGGQKYIESAAEFLVFCADLNRNQQRVSQTTDASPDYAWVEQFVAATVDVALVAQNIVVAAESVGLGCCYIGGIRNDPMQVTELLELPKLVFPVFGLCLGHPGQNPEAKPRLPADAILHTDRYEFGETEASLVDQYDEQVREYYVERTRGKLNQSWSEQMATQAASQTRPFIKKYLEKQGFIIK